MVVQSAGLLLVEVFEHHGELLEGVLAHSGLVTGLEAEPAELVVYPNPANEVLHLNFKFSNFRTVLRDGQGKKVYEGTGTDNLSIVTSHLSAGLYLLRVNEKVMKVVVAH